jgi:hypothetical protein
MGAKYGCKCGSVELIGMGPCIDTFLVLFYSAGAFPSRLFKKTSIHTFSLHTFSFSENKSKTEISNFEYFQKIGKLKSVVSAQK